VNFGISLSIWDWLFRTAYWPAKEESPEQQPERLGFPGMEKMPQSLLKRFLSPLGESARKLVGKGKQ
jgi:sterol desaturase/sphingolipid hydroxylase (fatty acid hydroxylase superfamily)